MIAALIVIFLFLIVFEWCNLRTISEIKEQIENLDIQVCELAEKVEQKEALPENKVLTERVNNLSRKVSEIEIEMGSAEPKRMKNESYLEDGFANLMSYDPHRKTGSQ